MTSRGASPHAANISKGPPEDPACGQIPEGAEQHTPMWLDSPQTLRQQIADEFRQCRTAQGCVAKKRERREAAGETDAGRERRECVTGSDDGRRKRFD